MGSFITRVKGAEATANNSSNTYANSLTVKATGGVLYALIGYNSGPEQWIQIHDSTGTPTNGTLRITLIVPTLSNFSFDWGNAGIPFGTGIVVANSTTGPTYTAGLADCWFHGTYR